MSRKPIVPDLDLWDQIKNNIKPLRARTKLFDNSIIRNNIKNNITDDKMHISKSKETLFESPRNRLPYATSRTLVLAEIDKRTIRNITKGKIIIEATLDLHGYRVDEARIELLRFLTNCQAQGLKTVLVITGKGKTNFTPDSFEHSINSKEGTGRIKKSLSVWFDQMQFRELVSGYQPAHIRHGGAGAFYVKIRRHK